MLPPNNRKGSGFTNINRVVTANQGNKLGQTVSSGVQNQANQVKQDTQKATTNFNTEAQQKRLDTDEAKNDRDAVIGRFTGTNSTTDNNQTSNTNTSSQPMQPSVGLATPVSGNVNTTKSSGAQTLQGPTDEELANFARYRMGTYEGPTQLQDYQSLAGKAQNTEMLGDLSRSSGGRQELLKRFVGGSGYTQGQQGLDNLLLGQSGDALNQARRATQGLNQEVAGANTQAANLAQEYANRAKLFGEETAKKLTDARNPISAKIDEQLKANQATEDTRLGNMKFIQDILSGQNDQYSKLDKITRLGLGLQAAKDAGYLTDVQANQLLGEGGLIQRAGNLGLDTNSLINERIKNAAAQNLNRGGAASEYQESQLNALDRLAGKQGADLEFNQPGADFQKGNVGFDLDSLNDYLNTTERAKYQNDAKRLAEQEAYNARYLNQAAAGTQQTLGGGMQIASAGLNQVLNPQSYYNPGQVGQNLNQAIQGYGNVGAGALAVADNVPNSLIEGLTKLNIGGNSIANTEGGKQLLKALELKNKLANEAQGLVTGGTSAIGNTAQDLLSGNLGGAWNNSYGSISDFNNKLVNNLGNEITNAAAKVGLGGVANSVGGAVGGAVKSAGSAVKSVSKKIKKVFSDETLKHKIKPADSKIYDLLDKLNAHEYEYKKDIQDDPRAGKGKHISVMAQELEKSDLGKELVDDSDPTGKMVDYDKAEPIALAAMASIHKRLKKLEGK